MYASEERAEPRSGESRTLLVSWRRWCLVAALVGCEPQSPGEELERSVAPNQPVSFEGSARADSSPREGPVAGERRESDTRANAMDEDDRSLDALRALVSATLPADWALVLEQVRPPRESEKAKLLAQVAESHPRPEVIQQVLRAFERLSGPEAVRALVALGERDARWSSDVAVRVSRLKGRSCEPALLEVVRREAASPDLRAAAVRALGATHLRRNVAEIARLAGASREDARVRAAAATALGTIADPDAIVPLRELLGEDERSIRLASIRALGRIRHPDAIAALEAFRRAGTNSLETRLATESLAILRGEPLFRP